MDETGEPILPKAKELLTLILIPQRINSHIITYYLRKALRVGAWRGLSKEARALLIVASRVGLRMVRSQILREILRRILLEIELHTLKGKALLYGILIQLRRGVSKLVDMLGELTKILCIGISYLNNPPAYRVID